MREMNKAEFASQLSEKLHGLSQSEVEKSIAFYTEMIDDRMEDGMDEEEAVSAMGDISEIAKEIMLAAPLPTLVKAKMKPQHQLKAWEIVLTFLGFPLWFPLAIAFFMVVLSVYITVWSVIISLYAVVLALVCSGFAGIVGAFMLLPQSIVASLFMLGSSAVALGLGIFSFLGVNRLSVWLVGLTKRFLRAVKSLFIAKDERRVTV